MRLFSKSNLLLCEETEVTYIHELLKVHSQKNNNAVLPTSNSLYFFPWSEVFRVCFKERSINTRDRDHKKKKKKDFYLSKEQILSVRYSLWLTCFEVRHRANETLEICPLSKLFSLCLGFFWLQVEGIFCGREWYLIVSSWSNEKILASSSHFPIFLSSTES